jgi:hypothetical protein
MGQRLPGPAAQGQSKTLDEPLQPRGSATMALADPFVETLAEDPGSARLARAPKAPHGQHDPDATPVSGKIRQTARVSAVELG